LAAGSAYKYRVKAVVGEQQSEYSNVIEVATPEKLTQTITFALIPDKAKDDADFAIIVTSDSGLPVLLTTSSPSIRITGNTIEILHPGLAKIKATQPGNETYLPAEPVEQAFCILPGKPKITSSIDNNGNFVLKSDSKHGNQWYVDGDRSDTTQTVVVAADGSYAVEVTSDNCSGSRSEPFNVLITMLEQRQTANQSKLRVYPNPAKDFVHVMPTQERLSQLRIIQSNGQVVHKNESYAGQAIDFSRFAPGMYLIEIIQGKERHTTKLLKD
jgi:hypothetical protein